MSYGFEPKCWKCRKYPKCNDALIIGGAISAIHSMDTSRGHLGAGMIELHCQNIDEKDDEQSENNSNRV